MLESVLKSLANENEPLAAINMGCEYRDLCDLYCGDYKDSPVVKVDRNYCETCEIPLKKGICPEYDAIKNVMDLANKHLEKANKGLEKNLEQIRENDL